MGFSKNGVKKITKITLKWSDGFGPLTAEKKIFVPPEEVSEVKEISDAKKGNPGEALSMSAIYFIGGEKGGVGKSVVARLLAQYYIDRSVPFAIVDADRSHGAMQRFYAEFTQPGDLDNFETSDHILQLALDAERRVLVDLPAQSDRLLYKWMDHSGIVELAAEHKIPLTFWHVMDGGRDSLMLLQVLLERYGSSVNYCIVRNLGCGGDFAAFDNSNTKKLAEQLHAKIITVDELHGATMGKIDQLNASFWKAAHNPDGGLGVIERHRVKIWLKKAYGELEKAGV